MWQGTGGDGWQQPRNGILKDFISLNPNLIDFYASRLHFFQLFLIHPTNWIVLSAHLEQETQ